MKRICVIASGGDAPGMNACLEAIYLHAGARGYETWVAFSGYDGLIYDNISYVTPEKVIGISGISGYVYKSARSPLFTTKQGFTAAISNIKKHGFEAVIVIGGNGSFIGAGRLKKAGIPVIGVPATIDNDVFTTRHNLGFSSACETAVQMVDMLRATMETNQRDHVVLLMGRHCDDLARTVGQATFADIIDMEGNRHTPQMVANIFAAKRKAGKTSCMMIMQERKGPSAIQEAIDAANYMQELCTVSGDSQIRMNTLGHLQRGAPPSCRDRFLAVAYGRGAVDSIVKKHFGVSLAMIDRDVCLVDLPVAPIP